MVMSSRAPDSSADFDQKGAWQIDGRGGGEQGGGICCLWATSLPTNYLIAEQKNYEPGDAALCNLRHSCNQNDNEGFSPAALPHERLIFTGAFHMICLHLRKNRRRLWLLLTLLLLY